MGIFSHSGGSNANHTCPTLSLDETTTDPIVGNWNFHKLNLVISAIATIISCLSIFILIGNHALHLSKPAEQLKIMRICITIPIYGILCFISVAAPETYVYLHPWTDLAQAFALGNFFLLMCELVSPNKEQRDTFFAALKVPQKKSRRGHSQSPQNGLAWYRKRWIAIFQFIPVSLLVGIFTCIFQAVNKYCLTSSKPYFAHLWLNIIHSISLAVAVMSIIRFYGALKTELAGHKPLSKLLAFKLLIGLNFLLQIIFWILNDINPSPLTPSSTLSYSDVTVGIPMLVNCLLMIPFSLFFHYAYDVRPYHLDRVLDQESLPINGQLSPPVRYQGGPLGIRAWFQMWNPTEVVSAIFFSFTMFSEKNKRQHTQMGQQPEQMYVYEQQGGGIPGTELEQNTAYEGRVVGYAGGPPMPQEYGRHY